MYDINKFKEIIHASRGLSVLYVEDNLTIQEKTKNLLETIFSKVDVASNGIEGIDAYRKKPYDLVITDIKMPKKDGISLIHDIKAINEQQAVIVTSAYDDANRLLELIALGISSFIVKPINMRKFFYAIDSEVRKITIKQMVAKHIVEQSKMAQMGEMIDSIAHQWKQPVAAISIMAQAVNYKLELNGTIPFEEVIKTNNNIYQQTQHLVETIDSFRSFFRPDQPLENIYLSELVGSVKNIMNNVLLSNGIELIYEYGDKCKINCIRTEFIHIFINLINNARDAFRVNNIENGKIIFEASQEEKENKEIVTIRVSDNGGGIPVDIIEHIFEPHFTTKEAIEGTGIGLYMSSQILKKIDGTISVENINTKYGRGASFVISIISIKE